MMKLLIISVTLHTPQNSVSNTIPHVTLNTINNVVQVIWDVVRDDLKLLDDDGEIPKS